MNLFLRLLNRVFWIICFFLPVKRTKVVFQSYYGRGYGDNPKYIADALIKSGEKLDLVWVVSGNEDYVFPLFFRNTLFSVQKTEGVVVVFLYVLGIIFDGICHVNKFTSSVRPAFS